MFPKTKADYYLHCGHLCNARERFPMLRMIEGLQESIQIYHNRNKQPVDCIHNAILPFAYLGIIRQKFGTSSHQDANSGPQLFHCSRVVANTRSR